MEKDLFKTTLFDKAKAANNNAQIDNLSERTVTEMVDMFYPQFVDDAKITDESWNLPVQMIKTLSGQLRHDTSTGINDFKTKYEAEHKTANEKAIADAIAAAKAQWEKDHGKQETAKEPANEPPKQEVDIDKKVEELLEKKFSALTGEDGALGKLSKQFSEYLDRQAQKEKSETEDTLRQQVLEYVLGFDGLDEDDPIVENVMLKLDIKSDKKVDDLKNEAKALYEKIYKNFIAKHGGGQPFNGGGGGNESSGAEGWLRKRGEITNAEAKAAEERKKLLK